MSTTIIDREQMASIKSPFFTVGTFVSDEAAGLLPVTQRDLTTVVNSMQNACYGSDFQPTRCALLSQMVGRIRMQNQCLRGQPMEADVATVTAVPASPQEVLASVTSQRNVTTSMLAALATVGATQQTVTGCVNSSGAATPF